MTNSHENTTGSPLPSKVNYPEMVDPNTGFSIGSDYKGVAFKRVVEGKEGPQGPQGIPGVAGPQGPQGIPGDAAEIDFYAINCDQENTLNVTQGFSGNPNEEQKKQVMLPFDWGNNERIIKNNSTTDSLIIRDGDSFTLKAGYFYKVNFAFTATATSTSYDPQQFIFRLGDSNTKDKFTESIYRHVSFEGSIGAYGVNTPINYIVDASIQDIQLSMFYYGFHTENFSPTGFTIDSAYINISTIAKFQN